MSDRPFIVRSRAAAVTAGQWAAEGRHRLGQGWNGLRTRLSEPATRKRLWPVAALCAAGLGVGVLVATWDWDWFRGPVAGYISAKTGRDVRILGHLRIHPFSLSPWASVGGLQVGNPRWMGAGRTADLGQTTVKVKLLPLLTGRLELPLVDIEQPTVDLFRDKTGRNNWTLGSAAGGKPVALPPIQRFILHNGRLRIVDQQKRVTFVGVVSTTETPGQANRAAFRMDGRGTLNHEAFTAQVIGAPMVQLRRDRPYPFKLDVRSGATRIVAAGSVARPFDFGRLQAATQVSGSDLADLYDLTGVVFPNTPNYHLAGDFRRDGQTYIFHRFRGRVGESDLHGELSVQPRGGRRFLKGDIASSSLAFADLNAIFGGAKAGKPAGAKAKVAPDGLILPDAPLRAERVRAMDADVRYRAESVRSKAFPLRQVALHLTLDRGLLKLDPVALTFPHGQLKGSASIDARQATPFSRVDLALTNVHAEDLLPKPQGITPLVGVIEARAKLSGPGDTVHKAASASNGTVAIALPEGRMRKALAELMGINVVPGLPELLAKDPKQTGLRCAVGEFDVNGGVLTARRLVVDTEVVALVGQGQANFRNETLDFTFKGKSKKPRLVRVIAPFRLTGHFASPHFGVEAGPVVAQAGAGLALGALLSPLAAILPFISTGGGHDADCAGLLAETRSAGAPVRPAAVASLVPGAKSPHR